MINWKGQTGVLYQKKIARREQDRGETERVCVRGSTLWKSRDGVSHKMSRLEESMWHQRMGLISNMIDKTLMMLLPWFAFVLCTSAKDISYDDKSHLSHSYSIANVSY